MPYKDPELRNASKDRRAKILDRLKLGDDSAAAIRDDDFPEAPPQERIGDGDGERERERRPRPARVSDTKAERELSGKLGEAESIINEMQTGSIAALAPFAPVSGGTWVLYAEANTRAVLTIARHRPKILAAILNMAELEAWIALGTFVGAMLVSVGVEMRMVDADTMVARVLKVTEAWEAVEREYAGLAEGEEGFVPEPEYSDNGAGGAAPTGLLAELEGPPGA